MQGKKKTLESLERYKLIQNETISPVRKLEKRTLRGILWPAEVNMQIYEIPNKGSQ